MWQTDRQTDRITTPKTALSKAREVKIGIRCKCGLYFYSVTRNKIHSVLQCKIQGRMCVDFRLLIFNSYFSNYSGSFRLSYSPICNMTSPVRRHRLNVTYVKVIFTVLELNCSIIYLLYKSYTKYSKKIKRKSKKRKKEKKKKKRKKERKRKKKKKTHTSKKQTQWVYIKTHYINLDLYSLAVK